MSLKTFHLIRAYPRIISFLSRNLSLFSAYFAGETDNNNAKIPVDGLTLRDFISHSSSNDPARRLQISSDIPSYIDPSVVQGWNRKGIIFFLNIIPSKYLFSFYFFVAFIF